MPDEQKGQLAQALAAATGLPDALEVINAALASAYSAPSIGGFMAAMNARAKEAAIGDALERTALRTGRRNQADHVRRSVERLGTEGMLEQAQPVLIRAALRPPSPPASAPTLASFDQAMRRRMEQQDRIAYGLGPRPPEGVPADAGDVVFVIVLTRTATPGSIVYAQGQRWIVAHPDDRAEVRELVRGTYWLVREVDLDRATTTNTAEEGQADGEG